MIEQRKSKMKSKRDKAFSIRPRAKTQTPHPSRDLALNTVLQFQCALDHLSKDARHEQIALLMQRLQITEDDLIKEVGKIAKALEQVRDPSVPNLIKAFETIDQWPAHPAFYIITGIFGQLMLAAGYRAMQASLRNHEILPGLSDLLESGKQFHDQFLKGKPF
jgi:hypothetical protein